MFETSRSIAPIIGPAFLIGLFSLIYTTAFAGETITAQEVEGYFYADGEMKRSDPQFENTYYVEGDTVTRTRAYDINKKEVIPDNTVYQIQRQLVSDPTKGLSLSGKPIIRAIGQPGTDAVEILVIGETFIQSVKSTSDYFVISRLKRIK
ncbi:MAG: hypothetical protein ACR2M4_11415 [Actinomycetota bacterium]